MKKTANKKQVKPSSSGAAAKTVKNAGGSKAKMLSAAAAVLMAIPFIILLVIAVMNSIASYNLTPYYSFWPFLGFILVGVMGLLFLAVTLVIVRKKSKRELRYQTVSILLTFIMVTAGFALLMNVVFPDLVYMATQGTLSTEAMYNTSEERSEANALLNRQFIMTNLLKGNLDGKYSYHDMSQRVLHEDPDDPENNYKEYTDEDIRISYKNYVSLGDMQLINVVGNLDGAYKELYDFIYQRYILMDYDYAFGNVKQRRSLALAMTDKCIDKYTALCKEGFNNPRLEQLRRDNYIAMNHDGYHTYDDPLLLLAQMTDRMTVPVIVRLILDKGYTYTEPIFDAQGNITGYDGYLFEAYEPDVIAAAKDKYQDAFVWDENGEFTDPETGYIYNSSGIVKRPAHFSVLDMLGDPMVVVQDLGIDINLSGINLGGIIIELLGTDAVSSTVRRLLEDVVGGVIGDVTGGASLGLQIYLDDDQELAIALAPANMDLAILGYMQMTYIESNNMLMGIVNLMGDRNMLLFIGAIGCIVILGACLLREYAHGLRKDDIEKRAAEAEAAGPAAVNAEVQNAPARQKAAAVSDRAVPDSAAAPEVKAGRKTKPAEKPKVKKPFGKKK